MRKSPEFKVINIDKKWLNQIEKFSNKGLLKYPRTIRTSQVLKLVTILNKGEYWDSPLVINKLNKGKKEIHIIDGTHRIFALQRFFRNETNYKYTFNQSIAVYIDLTEDEERLVYEKWNSGVRQTPQDWIVVNQDKVLLWKKISNGEGYPAITVEPTKDSYLFRVVFFASRCMFEKDLFTPDPQFTDLKDFTNESNRFFSDEKNLKILKRFLNWFEEQFGDLHKSNLLAKPNSFYPLIDIYMKNINLKEEILNKRFSRIKGDKNIMEKASRPTHSSVKRELRKVMLNKMNKGEKVNLI